MVLRLLFSVALLIVPLNLRGSDTPEWLAFDLSAGQLETDYQRTLGGRLPAAVDSSIAEVADSPLNWAETTIPVVFLAGPEKVERPREGAENPDDQAPENPQQMRINQLELENARLRERLARLEPAIDPVEPFVDPDWPPVRTRPLRRPRVRRVAIERPVPSPVQDVSRYPVRFKPFTRAAMDTPGWGSIARDREQSIEEQRRFFRNASKALGASVESREYRGVRLEVERAMLRGELNARYAAQYLSDIVEVFRTYESLKRFGLTDRVAPPVSAHNFRKEPDLMFRWASEVHEQRRKLNREEALAR